jgi:copper chaperone CopZ
VVAFLQLTNIQEFNNFVSILSVHNMNKKSLFHLDCNPIIPQCDYQCDKCVSEISAVLKEKEGVFEVTLTEKNKISIIAIEHDSQIISTSDLLKELKRLPSFYAGKFIPEAITF